MLLPAPICFHPLSSSHLNSYREHLLREERAAAWREYLLGQGQAPSTVNAKLSALNGLLAFLGLESCRVKFLRLQRRIFRESARELSQEEYQRLVSAAKGGGQDRLALLLETVCATGIRVSEVRYITVEAVRRGESVQKADLAGDEGAVRKGRGGVLPGLPP